MGLVLKISMFVAKRHRVLPNLDANYHFHFLSKWDNCVGFELVILKGHWTSIT